MSLAHCKLNNVNYHCHCFKHMKFGMHECIHRTILCARKSVHVNIKFDESCLITFRYKNNSLSSITLEYYIKVFLLIYVHVACTLFTVCAICRVLASGSLFICCFTEPTFKYIFQPTIIKISLCLCHCFAIYIVKSITA